MDPSDSLSAPSLRFEPGHNTDEVEGIGPSFREKLQTAGITTTDKLLEMCCNKQGRSSIAESTGISEKLVLNWTNKADLMRINGVGPQFSELLEAAGVDTVKELKHRKAENLAAKMLEVNTEKKLARVAPDTKKVEGWVDQAKGMEGLITH